MNSTTITNADRMQSLAFANPGDKVLWLAASDAAEEAGDDAAASFYRWVVENDVRPWWGKSWWRESNQSTYAVGFLGPSNGDIPDELWNIVDGSIIGFSKDRKSLSDNGDAYSKLLSAWRKKWFPGYVPNQLKEKA